MAGITACKERHLFSKAYAKGKNFPGKYFVLYLLPNYKSEITKFGITTSKKLGCAVRRNRVRRLAREAFREIVSKNEFKRPYIVIAVARSAAFGENVRKQDIVSDFEELFSESGSLVPVNNN